MGRDPAGSDVPRLKPEMASFRLLVLAFVRDYITRFGVSPSQGEIGHALDVTRTRVRHALRSLEKDGLILRGRGERAITLPSLRDEAIRQLRDLGWTCDEQLRRIAAGSPVSTVLPPPELDYPDDGAPLSQDGAMDGEDRGKERAGRRATR